VCTTIVYAGVEVTCVGDKIGVTDGNSVNVGIEFWRSSTEISSSEKTGIMLVAVVTGTYEYRAKGSVHAVREIPSTKTKTSRYFIV
jgi:hypothetical protein